MPLSSADFDIISESLEVLAPFKYATEELSGEKRVSASKIIPIIRMIQHKYIKQRCSNVESIRVLALAMLLDPRFKTLGFGNQDNAHEAERLLTAECASIIRQTSEHASQAEASSSQAAQNPPSSHDLWELLDSRVSETQQHRSCNADVTIEVKRGCSELETTGQKENSTWTELTAQQQRSDKKRISGGYQHHLNVYQSEDRPNFSSLQDLTEYSLLDEREGCKG
ncbi:hypothetical protein H4Q32_027927 [Labeo rohita]|uniref:Zinc finger BED domain-containing 4-like protein n=1 Tax=Labeo rohita TaxID=84645 RepID=A0ABQ8L8B8_LABRO|nr:hypothetical protein H4Q32_027927 [Labeo rohita]